MIGSIVLAGMGADITTNVTPSAEFTVAKNQTVFNVSLLAAAVTSADVNAKTARVNVRGGTLQTAREFLFTVRVNPLSVTLMFVGTPNTAPVTTTGEITIGTLEVTNGFNAQNINIVGARDYFRLESSDSDNRRLLILGGNNRAARAVTVVLRGDDDNENSTPAAMLTVTVMVVERVVLLGGGRVTVFAAADENEVVAVFQPVGGFPPYNNLNKLLPSGALPGGFQESAAAASVTITRTNTDLTAGDEHTIAYEVTETTMNGDSATATATVTVIASLSAQVMFAGGALTAGMAATVATISAAGGIGDYTFSANNNAVSFVDGTIAVANFNNAGTVSVNLIANDEAEITNPFTVAITLTALNTATAAPDNATFREFQTGASVTLANLTYSGGGDNVTATVITVQNGAGEVDGGELLVSSDMRGTAEVKVAVYDSVNDAAPKSTLTLSLEFVAPLTAMFTGNPNFMPLTNNAANIVIGTVTISGGDGDYQSPSLQVNTQDFAWSEGTILILNNTGNGNESARTVTALIVADDGSNISEQASLTVSVNVVAIPPLIVPPVEITVTTASTPPSGPAVTITPQGGTPPYRYLLFNPAREIAIPLPLPPNAYIRWSGGGGILSFYGAQMRAAPGTEAQDRIIVEDSSTPRRRIDVIATMHFVLPPPVTLSVNQTVNSTPAGASSVAVATLTYSGGSTGGALTATVVGVKDGSGEVSDNELLMSASASGEVIATINAYDSTNATAPNATAEITVTFTGGV